MQKPQWNFQRQPSTILKFLILGLSMFAFLGSLLLNLNSYFINSSLQPEIAPNLPCLARTFDFQKAMELQSQGIAQLRYPNGRTNVRATWELIPRHFNQIWRRQFDNLDVLRLQSDGEEKKHFVKFSQRLWRPYACNVITLGVGHSVWAELNLSKIYPECHFLAVDPASDINADLVQNQLGGTFIKAAIGGETMEKSMMNVWGKDVEVKGAQRRMVPQLGIFDFLRAQHNTLDPIDLLLVDVEGAEFGILEQFVDHPDRLPVPICQLNMEIHHPNELNPNNTHQRFFRYFDRLMRSRRFALLHTDMHEDPRYLFLRFFLVNTVDEICIRKFLC